MHLILPHLALPLHRDHSRFRSLRDDHRALALAVLLRQVRDVARNLLDVLRGQPMRLRIAAGLGLVPDEVVPVRRGLVQLRGEELRDERRAET